jgi:hypothetical protein
MTFRHHPQGPNMVGGGGALSVPGRPRRTWKWWVVTVIVPVVVFSMITYWLWRSYRRTKRERAMAAAMFARGRYMQPPVAGPMMMGGYAHPYAFGDPWSQPVYGPNVAYQGSFNSGLT